MDDVEVMAEMFIRTVPLLEIDGERLDYYKANTWVNNYKGEDING
jgi:hypothetical protein